jgi:hypothetical protein
VRSSWLVLAKKGLFRLAAFGDVFVNPHDAQSLRRGRVHRAATDACQEGATVFALSLAFHLHHLTTRQERLRKLACLIKLIGMREDDSHLLAHQFPRAPAVNLVEVVVGQHEAPLSRHRDAHRRAQQDGFVLRAFTFFLSHITGVDDHVVAPVHHKARR